LIDVISGWVVGFGAIHGQKNCRQLLQDLYTSKLI